MLQIDQKPVHKSNHHENHVSQITKTIQSQSNHGLQHGSHNQLHNQVNHTAVGNHEIHSGVNRLSSGGQHVNSSGQTNLGGHHQQKNHRNLSPSQQHQSNNQLQSQQEWRQPEETGKSQEESFYETGPVVNDGKHSLLQYAMLNFRQSTEKYVLRYIYIYILTQHHKKLGPVSLFIHRQSFFCTLSRRTRLVSLFTDLVNGVRTIVTTLDLRLSR